MLGSQVEVLTAASAMEAQETLRADTQIALVLCDQRMRGMSGLELLAWMRREGHKAKRILLTAYNESIFPKEELASAEPAALCTKPVDLGRLAALVASLLP